MTIDHKLYYSIINDKRTRSSWGQEFLRDILIPDLLGNDTNSILYWAGRRMAQKYPFKKIKQVTHFFKQTGLGILQLKKQSSHKYTWQLSSLLIAKRLSNNPQSDFMLEAGFLAKYTEQKFNINAEAMIKSKPNSKNSIIINVYTDSSH